MPINCIIFTSLRLLLEAVYTQKQSQSVESQHFLLKLHGKRPKCATEDEYSFPDIGEKQNAV